MKLSLSAALTVTVGIFTSGLTYTLLIGTFPLFPRNSERPVPVEMNNIFWSSAGLLAAGTAVLATTFSVKTALMSAAVIPLLLFLSLAWRLQNRKKRRALINREFPLLLDHLVMQIESGHSIQQALRSASGLFVNIAPLYAGLRELDESMLVGCSLSEALNKFGQGLDTPEAEVPLMAISQAVHHGTPLGKVLREQSKRMRESLILQGEQFANTLSVKMLIPLLFLIFPASFLVIFSPVIVALSGGLP